MNANCQEAFNLYVEHDESGEGKSEWQMLPTPGLSLFSALPEGPIRGEKMANQRLFVVAGASLYEIFSDGTYTLLGAVGSDGLPAALDNSATQLAVVSAGALYVFNLSTNVFSGVIDTKLGAVSLVAYSDGYFICLLKNSQKIQISTLLDATAWAAIDVSQVSVFPDKVLNMVVDHREIGLFGVTKTVWYGNSGGIFPFSPNLSSFVEQGIATANPSGLTKLDNSVFWIGQNEHGNLIGWRASPYTPTRVTNHAVETSWQSYGTVSDYLAYGYQDQGHTFWVVYFPTANVTWAYDVATGVWHKRAWLNPTTGILEAHLGRSHAFCFGSHIVGDRRNGNLYKMDIRFPDDDGQVIQRLRRAPHISIEQERVSHEKLQIDVETGLNPMSPPLLGVSVASLAAGSGNALAGLGDLYLVVMEILNDGTRKISPVFGPITNNDTHYLKPTIPVDPNAICWRFYYAPTAGGPSYYLNYTQAQMGGFGYTVIINSLGAQGSSLNWLTSNPARNPILWLRWSDDGGHTWSNQRELHVGQVGQYKFRCIARRLGLSRDRVYEVTCSDSIPWRFIDAYLKASPGYGPTERASSQLRKQA